MKKALSLLISLVLLASCVAFTASAAGTSMDNATPISFGSSYSGVMVEDGADYYKITLPSSGKITVSFSGSLGAVNFGLHNESNEEVDFLYRTRNSNSDILNWSESYDLVSGEYYIYFSERSKYTGNYSFSVSNGSTPPAEHPTQAPDNDPVYDTPDDNTPEDVTDPPADLVEPSDDGYIIPDNDSDTDTTINIYLDFEYTVINNYVVIVNYIGGDTYVTIPECIENYTVIGVGKRAFRDKGVETVYVPSTVTQFGEEAFDDSVELECISGSAAETYALNNGFAHTLTSNEIDDSPSPIGPIILVAAVVVIVAVAGVVAVIIIGKKKSVA